MTTGDLYNKKNRIAFITKIASIYHEKMLCSNLY